MADQAARIEQFRKMAEADPDNELGHFSLGRALVRCRRIWQRHSSVSIASSR